MRNFLLVAALFPILSFAQTSPEVIEFYRNGDVRFKSRKINDSTVVFVEHFRNGNTKDSVMLRNELPFGTRVMNYKNGQNRYVITYGTEPGDNTFKRFRRNGSLKATGGNTEGESFGPHYEYNRKGVATRFRDMNKGKNIAVPSQYKNGDHLEGKAIVNRFQGKKTSLNGNSKSVKLKTGALISLRLKGEQSVVHHYQIEGFSRDSVLVSKFRYDISRSRNTLAFDSHQVLAFSAIDAIYFGRNKTNTAEIVALAVTTAGFILFFEPILVGPIFQGIEFLAEPTALAMMGTGIPLMFWGKHLYKRTVPREYKLAEWKVEPKGF